MSAYTDGCDTLPKLLARNAASDPTAVALRQKIHGLWKESSWAEYEDAVREMALGLRELGLQAGDVVTLIGDNRAYWIQGEIAVHAAGGLSLGLYRDSLEDEVAWILDHTGATLAIAEDEEQVDKLLPLVGRLPRLRAVIYADPRGMHKHDSPHLMPLERLRALGRERHRHAPHDYAALVAARPGDETAILCPTSGTTARPKLAMLTPAALIGHSARYLRADPRHAGDDYVSILPLAWIMEQVYALAQPLIARMVVNFVEDPSTTMDDLREIGPSFVLLAPRQWEQMAADVHVRVEDGDLVKRAVYRAARHLSQRAQARGRRSRLADLLANHALRDRLGFARLRSAATGGAALGPETFTFFQSIGVPLRQLYGQTELIGAYTMHRPDEVDNRTVGVPFDDAVKVRIADPDHNGVGEIVARHPHMFSGYFRNPEATRQDLRDGWLHTGDAGYLDARGHLVVVDRLRDLATMTDGTRFSPQYIENTLKFSPNIAEAVVLGADRDALTALVCIRYAVVARWAERRGIPFTTYADLAANPKVQALLRADVEATNRGLPPAQAIRRFVLLYKELDADDGELTRTRKLRRGVIRDRYGDIIAGLYDGRSAVDVDTTITLQDGTRQPVRTTLAVVTCNGSAPATGRAP